MKNVLLNLIDGLFTAKRNLLLAVLFVLSNAVSFGQASITSATAVTDALATSLGASAPANWTMSYTGGTNFNGTAQTTGTTGGWYGNGNISFLGSGSASNGNATWLLQNNSGVTLTGFTLSYTARMWKSGTASPSVTVSYSNSATITNPAAGALTNALSSLTVTDATANISTGTTMTQTVTGLSIATGQYIFVRFIHAGGSSSDNLGWDDLSFTPTLASAAPTINGTIAAGEYGTHTNGNNQQSSSTGTWYMTSDATNLYIGVSGANTTQGAIIYLDKNPITPVNGGSNTDGNLTGNSYDGSSFGNLQFRSDLVVYFKDGYQEYRTATGTGTWSAATTTGMTYSSAGGTVREIAIPWSSIGGRPAAYNWFGYVAYAGGGAYASVPTENPGSGGGLIIGSSATWDRYYTVSTTSTMPFSRDSYTFTSGSDVTSFGTISAYDFTMNSSGRFLSRSGNVTGNWTIGGNLTVGAGTIYLGSGGSGYGTTSIAGNLNILGGSFNMDQTTGAATVTGNVSVASGGNLTLSGTSGGDMTVQGNWSNSGTFTCNGRQVVFAGSTAQTLSGTNTFDYLKINNAAGLTLQASSPVTINTNIDLTSGKLTLGANNLTLLAAASPTNASATSYIVTNSTGALVRNSVGNTATAFPVGLAASYTPLTVTNTGTSNNLSLVVTSPPANAVTDATKIVNLEWNLNSAGAGAVGTIAFNWNTGNQGASYSATGTGELGNYTAGPNYAITSIGTMAGQTKTVTGVVLSSGNNKLVLGNSGAVLLIAPANDLCSNATALTIDAAAITGTLTGAGPTSGLTYATAKNDVWYSFTPVNTGSHTITVNFASGPDLDLDVFTTSCPTSGVAPNLAHTTATTSETLTATFNAGTTYYIRVVDYNTNASAFTINVTGPPATLNTSVSTLSFGTTQAPLTQSTSQTFNLTGFSLTGTPGTITVTAPNTDYQVSNNNSTWGATTTIAYSSSILAATPVYVRFTPQSSGTKTGNITFSGGGVATPPTVSLTGTAVLPAPVATAAANIGATSFDANWNAIPGATSGYLLDVSTSPTFGTTGSATVNEGFSAGTTAPSGWTFTTIGGTYTSAGNYGASSPSIQMDATGDRILTSTYSGSASQLSVWMKGQATDGVSALLVEGYNGTSWVTIQNILVSLTGTTYTYNSASTPALPANLVQFRFTYTKSSGNLAFDDVSVTYDTSVPSFVTGYNAKVIAGQSTITSSVTGLTADTTYYYRLRATDGTPSAYSNVITVYPASRGGSVTADQTICYNTQPAALTLSGNNGTVVKWQKASDAAFTTPIDIAGTSLTLNGATIGNLIATTYFRAVVQSYTNPVAYSNYITVTILAPITYANLQSPSSGTICLNGNFTVYGQVYLAGVTPGAGQGAGITAEFGYSTSNTDPSTWTNWTAATFNSLYPGSVNDPTANNDEYMYTFTPPAGATYYYTFRYKSGSCAWLYGGYSSSGGGFWNTFNVSGVLTVNPKPTLATVSATPACANTPSTVTMTGLLPSTVGSITYTNSYTGSTVYTQSATSDASGNFSFNTPNLPLIANGAIITITSGTVTATGCTTTFSGKTVPVVVNPILTAGASIVASPSGAICAGTSVTFTATPTNGGASPTYQWKVNGTAVSGQTSPTFTTSAIANGDVVTVTMTSNATPCLTGSPVTSAGITMTVNAPVTPIFTTVSPICSGATLSALPTTSNNGVVGTWSPALDNTTTTTYTFTPNAGQCATTTTLAITVNSLVTPTFTAVSPICSGSSLSVLPTTSNNGVVGTWSPALNNTATTTYTFSPNAGQCATTTTLTITVNPLATASIVSNNSPICGGSTASFILTGTSGAILTYTINGGSSNTVTLTSGSATINVTGATSSQVLTLVSVSNGSCTTTLTSTSSVSLGATTTYTSSGWDNGEPLTGEMSAIISAPLTIASNLNACSLTITNNSAVTVSSGYNVTLYGALTVDTGSSFSLSNNANLLQSSNIANSSNITVNRDSNSLLRQDYTMWSSPVTGSLTLKSFSPATLDARFYNYNTSSNLYNVVTSPSTTTFGLSAGYLIRTPNTFSDTVSAVYHGVFTGVPNNGNVPVALNYYGTGQGFNMIGNPYPSTVDADAFISANSSNIESTLYFWRKTNAALGSAYATYNSLGSTSTSTSALPNGIIQVGQGFLVDAKNNNGATFTNAMRAIDNNNQFFKNATIEKHRMWLNLTNASGLFSQTLLGYVTNATQGIDSGIDGKYINDSPISLTSIINGDDFTIQGRSLPFDTTDVVPLDFKTNSAGDFTISLDHFDGLFSTGQDIYLRDNAVGTIQDLKAGSYTFSATIGSFNNRFEIIYLNPLTVHENVFNENSVVVYNNNGTIYINSGAVNMDNIKVFDIRGRLLTEKSKVNTTQASIDGLQFANQVLIVQITSDSQIKISKKIVN